MGFLYNGEMDKELLTPELLSPELLTPEQAAGLKGVSRAAIYRAMAEGRLPHCRVLGRLGIREVDLLKWTPKPSAGRRAGTSLSQKTKERIGLAQRTRWAQRKRWAQRRSGRRLRDGVRRNTRGKDSDRS